MLTALEWSLSRIEDSQNSGYRELYLLRHNAVWSFENQLTLWRNKSAPSSESKYKPSKEPAEFATWCHAGFDPQDVGHIFLQLLS
jgi:hypothetical protein